MKSGAEGAHFFGALLLTFSFDKHIVSALLFGNCYTVKATTPESAVTDTAEGYLSLLAREMYLYEEADVTPFTLSSRNMELQPKVAMEMWQTDELIKVEEDLKTIEDIAEFTKYYRKASGITRENFNVDYTFDDIQIDLSLIHI